MLVDLDKFCATCLKARTPNVGDEGGERAGLKLPDRVTIVCLTTGREPLETDRVICGLPR
eukprot:CAMPEP_0194529356 /NCGR_PEP_ID=MMETSP0253-20130528/65997_1 /TAXON_ID=2966 /ORGANISM="Noctiluca scintillans" /LENGTH=59 /DNA_ID=CAMNT_0039374493 /DNA_START=136 /DNA_END=312 /DNA_ORIENTATION=-